MASARDYLVQSTASALSQSSFSDIKIVLPHPTLANNTLVLFIEISGATVFTITDDGSGNTWTQRATITSSQSVYCYTCENASTGTRNVRVQFDAARSYYQAQLIELCYIATSATDGTTTAAGASTSMAAGSFTPTTDADLIVQYGLEEASDGWYGDSFGVSTVEPDWEFIHTDLWDGTVSQFTIQDKAGAINPTMSVSPSTSWVTIAIALKTNRSRGTPRPTNVVRVRRRQFHSKYGAAVQTIKLQLPSMGGGLAVLGLHSFASNASDHSLVSITDPNNKILQRSAGEAVLSGGARVDQETWYDPHFDGSNSILTLTYGAGTSRPEEITCVVYDIVGCDPSRPLGATMTGTGSQPNGNANSDLTVGTITPQRAGSILIGVSPIDIGTVIGSSAPSSTMWDEFVSTGMDGGFNRLEEDNGHGFYVTPSTAQVTWTWLTSRPNGAGNGVGNWSIVLVEFMPLAAPRLRPLYVNSTRRRGHLTRGTL